MVFSSFRGVCSAHPIKPPSYVRWVAECTTKRDALARQHTAHLVDRAIKAVQINALTAAACLHPHGANLQTGTTVALDATLGAKSLAAPLVTRLLPLRAAAPWAVFATAHLSQGLALGCLMALGGQWQPPKPRPQEATKPPSMLQGLVSHGLLGQLCCAATCAAAAWQRSGHRTLSEVALGAAAVGAWAPALARVMADGLYAAMALPSALVVFVFGLGCDLVCLGYGALRGQNEPELYLYSPPIEIAPPSHQPQGVPLTTPLLQEARLPYWQQDYLRKQRSLPKSGPQRSASTVSLQAVQHAEARGAVVDHEVQAFRRLCELFESKCMGAVALYIFSQEVNVDDYLAELSQRLRATVAAETCALYGDRVAAGEEALRAVTAHGAKWREAMRKRPPNAHLFEGEAHQVERKRVLVALREALAFTGADDLRHRHCSAALLQASCRGPELYGGPASAEALLDELRLAEQDCIINKLNGIMMKLAKIRHLAEMPAFLASYRLEAPALIPQICHLRDSIRLYASQGELQHHRETKAAVLYWLQLQNHLRKPPHNFGKSMGRYVHPDKMCAFKIPEVDKELAHSLYGLTSELFKNADILAALLFNQSSPSL